jgi:Plasmid pRiA4b ORF-3-like protein
MPKNQTTPDQNRVLELKIWIRGVRPIIWRRVRVPSTLSLSRLHLVIQVCFGWRGHSTHLFQKGKLWIGPAGLGFEETRFPFEDEEQVACGGVFSRPGQYIDYHYDFSSQWVVRIRLEPHATDSLEESFAGPLCLAGEWASPPEGISGPSAFRHAIQLLGFPDHIDFEDARQVLGPQSRRREFAPERINRKLARVFHADPASKPKYQIRPTLAA